MPPVIRRATPQDAAAIQAIYAPIVRETSISFEVVPPAVEEMRRRIAATSPRYPYLVLDCDGVVAGYAYTTTFSDRAAYDWSVSTSIYLDQDWRGRGAGRALYASLIPAIRLLGYRQVYAGIALPNEASVALHERVGFRHLGTYERAGYKLGAWHSVGWWQLLLDGFDDGEPAPPRPIEEFENTEALRAVLEGGLAYLRG